MAASNCTWTIANQGDASTAQVEISGNYNQCKNYAEVNITGATGTLNFTTLEAIRSLNIYDSPHLEAVFLPEIQRLDLISINNATSLAALQIPKLGEGIGSDQFSIENLIITNAPALRLVNLTSASAIFQVTIHDVVPDGLEHMMYARELDINTGLSLPALSEAGSIQISGPGFVASNQLDSIESLTLLNVTWGGPFVRIANLPNGPPSIQVNGSMTLYNALGTDTLRGVNLDRIQTVGVDVNITAYSHLDVEFHGLTTIGANLSLANNTNCTFSFEKVSSAMNLRLLDNWDTVLPLFPKLQTVENVHMRGYIDTSGGPNIFPALQFASGNVTIEAWNADFNCSKLVSQWRDRVINNLSCNGTDNGTSVSTPTPTLIPTPTPSQTSTSSLSPAALAGIGVSAALVGIGLITATIWLLIHYKRRLEKLELAQRHQQERNSGKEPPLTEVAPPLTGGLHETSGVGIVREMPDHPLVEMAVPEAELPTSPQSPQWPNFI